MDPRSPEARRLINTWNATRHGWNHFQTGSRHATLRLARKPHDLGLTEQHSTNRQETPMDARARIHALLPTLDPNTRAELDKHLTTLEAETIQDVIQRVESLAGDTTAETVRDDYPHLDAMLRGEAPPAAPALDIEALDAQAKAEAGRLCTCRHYRDKHSRDFLADGKPIRCWECDCMAFTDSTQG
ncbi:hypothetical protein OOK48_35100 [Streptomyces viridodiastaticus]|uniref:hypothetical protein n=1 Tax=Streptomyces albogriseolus TaxID=1887 RepID=UPI00224F67F4|nr:hypothetical protein [Streptomyces viridodiastaticus]MCX4571550.1 hypothetical protein [Streptomyces viridodiastaticus]